ncbi:MAG: hypothetical protein ABW224_25590 [Kibdelosporangium sp.]
MSESAGYVSRPEDRRLTGGALRGGVGPLPGDAGAPRNGNGASTVGRASAGITAQPGGSVLNGLHR